MSKESHRLMVFSRYTAAFFVLVLMPWGTIETIADPSRYHLILLATTAADTIWAGAIYRAAIRRWNKDNRN